MLSFYLQQFFGLHTRREKLRESSSTLHLKHILAKLPPREREKEDPSLKLSKERVLRWPIPFRWPIPLQWPIPHPHRPILCPRPLLTHPLFSGNSVDPPPSTHPSSSPSHLCRPICLHSFPSKPTSFLFPQDLGFYGVHIVCFYFDYMIWLR